MFGSDDTAIGTLAEFFDKLVLGVNDKRRVECVECVSLHRGDTRNGRW